MNDVERAQWVDNDEGLQDLWISSRLPKKEFIRRNRAQLDIVIENVISGHNPAHYLKYGQNGQVSLPAIGCLRAGERSP